MAIASASDKFLANTKIENWDHDPGGTDPEVTTPDGGTTTRWVDMRDFEGLVVVANNQVLSGNGITKLEIVAAEATAEQVDQLCLAFSDPAKRLIGQHLIDMTDEVAMKNPTPSATPSVDTMVWRRR